MSEATVDPNPAAEAAALRDLARDLDRAHIKQIGSLHFAMVMGVITMWGAAEAWAQVSGWGIAQFASIANALRSSTSSPAMASSGRH